MIETIAGIAAGVGQAVNAIGTAQQNWQQRKFAEDMYNRQLFEARADWDRQNAYNSPANQMARLRAAGLNPNLVYGNGQAQVPAQAVRGANQGSYKGEAPQFDLGSMLGSFQDAQVKKAQLNNLAAQENLLIQNAINKGVDTENKIRQGKSLDISNLKGQSDLTRYDKLGELSLEALQQGIFKTQGEISKIEADTKFTLNQQELNTAKNASDLKEATQRIAESRKRNLLMEAQRLETQARTAKTKEETFNVISQRGAIYQQIRQMEAATQNTETKTQIDKIDLAMKKLGVNPNDPVYLRVLGRILDGVIPSTEEIQYMMRNPDSK